MQMNISKGGKAFIFKAQRFPAYSAVRWGKSGPWDAYKERIRNGEIDQDAYQLKVVEKLQNLHEAVLNHSDEDSSFMRFFKSRKTPKGLYIHGAVGGGKTMLLDLFYQTIDIKKKQRTHFHEFMLNVHKKIHNLKKEEIQYQDKKPNLAFDPIPKVAKHMASECWLICLDEFQVTDIADAMILKRLFSTLFQCGVILLATSNRDPDSLYKHGLQRFHFLPFIQILKDHCDVMELNPGIDYRLKGAESSFFFITNEESDAELKNFFKLLCSKENDTVRKRVLTVQSRSVTLETVCGRIAYCTFVELCDRVKYSHF